MNERPEVKLDQLDTESQNPDSSRAERLRELFPEAVTEGTGDIDFDKLRELLGEHINTGKERYAFTWPGKHEAIRQSQTPSTATLRPLKEKSVDWDTTENLYIEGDNLEVLKLLQRSYHGQVDMIYIDPPYNTGNDFVYKDSFGDTIENYREQTGQEHASNPETNGRFHSNWLNMMYPRLRLAREMLKSTGILVASIDENERKNLQCILDEIFGESNFAGEIIWKNSSKNDQRYISIQHEYLLIYVKDKNQNTGDWKHRKSGLEEIYNEFNHLHNQYGEDWQTIHEKIQEWYRQFPPSDPISSNSHYSWMDEHGVYFPADISGPNAGQYVYDVIHPITGKVVKMPTTGWRYPESEMNRRIAQNLVHFGKDETTVPNNKTYLKDTEYQSIPSILYRDGRVASKSLANLFGGTKVFSNPKDVDVLASLMESFNIDDNGIVMDFFSGSGSIGEAAMRFTLKNTGKLRWILVQLPENLLTNLQTAKGTNKTITRNAIEYLKKQQRPPYLTDLAEERLRLAGADIRSKQVVAQPTLEDGEPAYLDTGFRVFALDSSNLKSDEYTPGQELDIDLVKRGRTNDDLLFEVMLRWGLDLSLPVEMKECNGYEYLSVAEGELVCCMNDGLTVEVIEHIVNADDKPRRVFIPDHVFGEQNNLKLNIVDALRRASSEGQEIELRTV